MHSLRRAIAVAVILFGASVVGMLLQWVVPAQVLTASKGTVGAMVGLVTLLLALVLGLLVFTAFSVFTTQRDEALVAGAGDRRARSRARALWARGGARTRGLRAALERSRARFFGDAKHGPQPYTFEETRATLHGLDSYFDSLEARDRRATPAADLRQGSREEIRRHANADGPPARQSVSALRADRGGLLGVGALSRQWTGRDAECGHRRRASGRRDRHRQRDLPDPGAEPALHSASSGSRPPASTGSSRCSERRTRRGRDWLQ